MLPVLVFQSSAGHRLTSPRNENEPNGMLKRNCTLSTSELYAPINEGIMVRGK